MTHITVIFTGGTIGSKSSNGIIAPNSNQPYCLLGLYRQLLPDRTDLIFHTREPYQILSENLDAAHINLLITEVASALKDPECDGIIVTHGTDTLQYTAAILSYVFSDTTIPILLVSSNYVLDDPRSNGFSNFVHAAAFICGKFDSGVFVSYQNAGERPRIHYGSRLQYSLQYTDYVSSIYDSWYGEFRKDPFLELPPEKQFIRKQDIFGQASVKQGLSNKTDAEQPSLHKPDYDNYSLSKSNDSETDSCITHTALTLQDPSPVLRIHPCPGMQYPTISENTRAILFETYHSGTMPITDGLTQFCQQAVEKNIPIYLTGLPSGDAYESTTAYKKLGIQPLPASAISQYCKLWIACDNQLDLSSVMQTPWGHDLVM